MTQSWDPSGNHANHNVLLVWSPTRLSYDLDWRRLWKSYMNILRTEEALGGSLAGTKEHVRYQGYRREASDNYGEQNLRGPAAMKVQLTPVGY